MAFDLDYIRAQSPIEEIAAQKFALKKVGTHYIGEEHDSFVVNPRTGWYHWNSQDEHGDVFDFVGRHILGHGSSWNSRDADQFMAAVRYLAERKGIRIESQEQLQNSPTWNERQLIKRLQQALQDHPPALQYARGRGWSDRLIDMEKLGFMPADKSALLKDLRLKEGLVKAIRRFPDGMLVYVFTQNNRLTYLHGRSIEGKRHYNPPRELIGDRQPYYNHYYNDNADEVILVEGPADAISFAAWGIPAIAAVGVHVNDLMISRLQRHRRVFVALDNTEDANAKSAEIARRLGPRACLPTLPPEVKDANEWLVRQQPTVKQVRTVLNDSPTLIDFEVSRAQGMFGLAREDMIHDLIERAATWERRDVAKLKLLMKDKLGVSMSLFNDTLKAAKDNAAQQNGDDPPDILPDATPIISPALGFTEDLAFVTVSIMERTKDDRLNVQPYLVTSSREFKRLDDKQIISLNDREVALRVIPESTEFLRRWRYGDIQKFIQGETVEPGAVYQAVHEQFTRYVDFGSEEDAHVIALWVIGTYFYTMFDAYPYIALNGPKNSGKSTVLTVAKPLAFNMITTSDITGPSLFRLIHRNSCSVGIDEAERYHTPRDTEMQQIRQLLNSGYKPGMPAIRLIGEEMKPEAFDVYSPKMLANIMGLEDVLASRCIRVPMRRADRTMPPVPHGLDGGALRHQLYALMLTYFRAIHHNYHHRPDLCDLQNRSRELWMPLFALAAFFEEQGEQTGLLDAVQFAAERDALDDGRSLSEREEAILQALEILTRAEGDTWLKWTDLREQVRLLLDLTEETMGSGKWIQNTMKRLQLLDRSSKRSSAEGRTVKVDRGKVVDMMLRYQVATVK